MSEILYIVFALLLVLANGFFVAAEFAIVKLRQTQADELADTHGFRGRILHKVRSNLDAYLSACQLGITLASLGLGWIGEPAFARLLEPVFTAMEIGSPDVVHGVSFVLAFTIISFLHIVLGELAPKSVSIRFPESSSLWTAVPLFAFYWLMYPFIWVLNGSALLVLKVMGIDLSHEGDDAHSAEEIRQVLMASHQHGELNATEAEILTRAIDLGDLTAGDLMRPAREMIALDMEDSLEENLAIIGRHRFSRYPVYENDRDEILGLVHVKDLYAAQQKHGRITDLKPLLRPLVRVEEDTPAPELLARFQSGAPHFAVVYDELGHLIGFITMDHVMGALIGGVRDEFEHLQPDWEAAPDGSYVGAGSLPVYSLERLLSRDIEFGDVNSVGGLVMEALQRVPRNGDVAEFDGFRIEVLTMRGPRIARVRVRPAPPPTDDTA
ncbi:MAG TPA: hemolysin family protein [Gammaproteobacteria bacterium]|nr:hemolysin family protein [Gammaproteobacteria bacterium]